MVAPGSVRFSATEFDTMGFANAKSAAQTDCLRSSGAEVPPLHWQAPDPEYLIASALGVWREEDAERFAFAKPAPIEDMMLNKVDSAVWSEAEEGAARAYLADMESRLSRAARIEGTAEFRTAMKKCASNPAVAKWEKLERPVGGPWGPEFFAAGDAAFRDARMKPIKADFVACVRSAGSEPAHAESTAVDEIFTVQGEADDRVDEQQIKLALLVVKCKAQTKAIERTMRIWAQYESPIYEKYSSELIRVRRNLDAARVDADEFWAARAEK